MTVLEHQVADLNKQLMSLTQQHAELIGEYFAADSAALGPARAAGMAAIDDRLQVPPGLLPATVRDRLALMHRAFRQALMEVFDRRMGGRWEQLADELRLDEATRRYIDFDRRPRWIALGRPDLVLRGDDLAMTEPNAGSSFGAMPGTDILGRIFESSPVIGDFLRDAGVRRPDAMGAVSDLIRHRLRDAGEAADALVLVTELREEFGDPDYHHCEMFAAGLRWHGLRAEACAVEDMDCGTSGVTLRGQRCAAIFRKWGEQPDPVGQYPVLAPFLRAAREGRVLLIDDLGDQIAGNKSVLALISEEMDSGTLSGQLTRDLAGFIPWTRLVTDGPATISGDKIDLLPWCIAHKDDLVLKPGSGYQAQGVTLGCEINTADWTRELDAAHKSADAWLVQRLVRTTAAEISVVHDGRLRRHCTFVDYGYFAVGDTVPAAAIRRHPALNLTTRVVNFELGGYSPAFFV